MLPPHFFADFFVYKLFGKNTYMLPTRIGERRVEIMKLLWRFMSSPKNVTLSLRIVIPMARYGSYPCPLVCLDNKNLMA
jgi:hypothetical protein